MNINVNVRREVLTHIEQYMGDTMFDYLKPIDTNWQPADLLPDATRDTFFQEIKDLQENAKGTAPACRCGWAPDVSRWRRRCARPGRRST